MKIALIVPHFFGAFRGHEYYLAPELAKLGNHVRVLTSNILPTRYFRGIKKIEPQEKVIDNLYEVQWLSTPLEIRGIPLFNPTEPIRDYKPDIIHAQEFFQFCSQKAFLTALKMETPFIFTQHKYDYPKGLWKTIWKTYGKFSGKYICERSSHITAISNAAKQFLVSSMSVPESRVSIIPLGVDTTEFRPLRKNGARLKEELELEGKTVILFVGRLTRVKGVHYLIRAFLKIHKKMPDTRLLIRGEGDLKEHLLRFISNHGLKHAVILLPFIPREKLPILYAMSDIFVLPSLKEPFGLVLLEAMACEKPVVGTRVGGIPDIIKDNVNGFLVNPGVEEELAERLEILVRDEELRTTMGFNARRLVEKEYCYKIIAYKTLKIYEECVNTLKKRD